MSSLKIICVLLLSKHVINFETRCGGGECHTERMEHSNCLKHANANGSTDGLLLTLLRAGKENKKEENLLNKDKFKLISHTTNKSDSYMSEITREKDFETTVLIDNVSESVIRSNKEPTFFYHILMLKPSTDSNTMKNHTFQLDNTTNCMYTNNYISKRSPYTHIHGYDTTETTDIEATEEDIISKSSIIAFDNASINANDVYLILDAAKALKLIQSDDIPSDGKSITNNTSDDISITNDTSDGFNRMLSLIDLMSNITFGQYKKTNSAIRRSAPTCPHTPNYETPSQERPYYYAENFTGSLVTTCYVCGLEENEIPTNTRCEDAFSDDSAKHQYQYGFKKYCRYDQYTKNYCVDHHDPHAVWGQWTGGCSVRKIDISGIYTQRSCRNRFYPTMGNHFASHRMAKLEFTLFDVDEGCTISPIASLVPLSRSISLYARFTACVCSGRWCNTAKRSNTPAGKHLFMLYIVLIVLKVMFT